MGRFYLERGLVIEREGRTLEFHHSTDAAVYFEDPTTRDIEKLTQAEFWRAFETKELRVVKSRSTPDELQLPEVMSEDAPELRIYNKSQVKAFIRRCEYCIGVLKRGFSRGQRDAIEEARVEIAKERQDEKPPGASTICEWLKKLEEACNDYIALLSKKAVGECRDALDPEHEALINKVIDAELKNGTKAAQMHAGEYKEALTKLNAERIARKETPFVPVSYRTFCRRVEAIEPYEKELIRSGFQAARNKFRMAKGHMPGTRPLDYVEIDHAKLRLWVLDDILMLPLGRPWITAIRDRYTRMLLGLYLTFRPPSLASVFGAIRHSITPHLDLRSLWPALENEWHSWGLGAVYVSDRALEFLSLKYRQAIFTLGGAPEYCETHTPWHKPYIERSFFSMFAEMLETIPGRVYPGLSYNKDYNPKTDAVIRFSTLVYLLVKWAADVNPFRELRGGLGRPIDRWNDSIADAPPGSCPDPDLLNVTLGLPYRGTICQEGIRFKHLSYANDGLHDIYKSTRKLNTRYVVHEPNLGRIYVENRAERQWLEVECTRPDYAEGLSMYQHQTILREARAKSKAIENVEQLLRVRQDLQAKVADDLAAKETARKLQLARLCGMNSTAVMAGHVVSVADLARPTSDVPANINAKESIFTDVPHIGWGMR